MSTVLNERQMKIVDLIQTGNLIDTLNVYEYPAVRADVHAIAGWFIDTNQVIKAQIALTEIARLDREYQAVRTTNE